MFGLTGAAFATCATLCFAGIVRLIEVRKLFGFVPIDRRVCGILFVTACLSFGIGWAGQNIASGVVSLCLTGVVAVLAVIGIGVVFRTEEDAYIGGRLLRRVGKQRRTNG